MPGVAPDRLIFIENPGMRHGQKSRRQRFDGCQRQVMGDLDTGLVRAVGITHANTSKAAVTQTTMVGLAPQGGQLVELHVERSYLSRACWSGSGWQSWRSAVKPGLYTMGDASRRWPAQENLFDVRLAAAIYNLHVITRVVAATQDLAA
jgi:hypothetical protein